MSFPCSMKLLCGTRCIRIFVFFVQSAKNTVCLLLKFCPSSISPELKMECKLIAHRRKKEEIIRKWHCPVMKDQWDCVLNVLEKLGDTQLFLKNRYGTGIFSCFLLLPTMLSTCYQTNKGNTRKIWRFFNSPELNGSIFFSIHTLWMTNKMHNFFDTPKSEKYNFPASTSVQILFPTRTVLGEQPPASSLLCGFTLAFDQHAKVFCKKI